MTTSSIVWVCCVVWVGCGFQPAAVPSDGSGNDATAIDSSGGDGGTTIDASSADAEIVACSTTTCPGMCVGETCVIDCSSASPCVDPTCPSGMACEVTCTSGDVPACTGTVSCPPDHPCTVTCTGSPDVAPGGPDHPGCELVDCNGACSCDVTCNGSGIVGGGPGCSTSPACPQGCETTDGCAANGPCDTCP